MAKISLVFVENDTPLTTSRTVAEKFGKQHQHVMRDIRDLFSQAEDESKIGRMFHETTYADKYGREKPMYTMTRDGFSLLAMGFTGKKALQFKLKFIDAFNRMEETLRELAAQAQIVQNEPRWLETRQNTKISHKPFTYAIKLMIDYLNNRGKEYDEGRVYGRITNIVQNACGIIKGQRDSSPVANLNKCDQCQSMVANLILNIIAVGQAKSLADFEAKIILQLSNLNNLLCGQPVLLLTGEI